MLETDFKKMKVAVYCRLSKEENKIEDEKLKYIRNKLNKNFKKYLLNNYEKKRVKYKLPLKNTELVTYQTSADSDKEYLNRCLTFYKKNLIRAYGVYSNERDLPNEIGNYLRKYNPDILVITGHDAYYRKRKGKSKYKNTENFILSVKEARKYEPSHDKLIIIAGACQSDYEELIKSGANFASSPKRINIHALDPAVIATSMAFADHNKDIDLLEILNKTKYKTDGMGGIITKGTMYIGFPR